MKCAKHKQHKMQLDVEEHSWYCSKCDDHYPLSKDEEELYERGYKKARQELAEDMEKAQKFDQLKELLLL
jgi:hypothetical protein